MGCLLGVCGACVSCVHAWCWLCLGDFGTGHFLPVNRERCKVKRWKSSIGEEIKIKKTEERRGKCNDCCWSLLNIVLMILAAIFAIACLPFECLCCSSIVSASYYLKDGKNGNVGKRLCYVVGVMLFPVPLFAYCCSLCVGYCCFTFGCGERWQRQVERDVEEFVMPSKK